MAMQSSSSYWLLGVLAPRPGDSSSRRLCRSLHLCPTPSPPIPITVTIALRLRAAASPHPHPDPPPAPLSPFQDSAPPAQGFCDDLDLTLHNVDRVLDDVRPYLISDGGNVQVLSVHDGVVSLQLQGACGSCPSSTTTMKMGIERVLKEKFGHAVKDIRQVSDQLPTETTVQAVNNHLDILRPAIKNYGGSVEVLSVDGEDCLVKYVGPESIGSGIKAAIKERFQDIVNVVFTE